ncbi:MAG: hypothetical protein AB8B77_01325 [Alphaproteobacteria bacterium]
MAKKLPSESDLNKIDVIQAVLCDAYKLRRFELLRRTNSSIQKEARSIGLYIASHVTTCSAEQASKAFLYARPNAYFAAIADIKKRLSVDEDFKQWVLATAKQVAIRYKQHYSL